MNKPYKLTILGYPVKNSSEIGHCFELLTYGLQQEFSKLSHIELSLYNIENPYSIPKDIPQSDFILATSWGSFFRHKPSIDIIKSKCKYFSSFLEIGEPCNFSFIFINDPAGQKKYTIIPAPYYSPFYKQEPKDSKTILIDHFDTTLTGKKISPEKYKTLDLTKEIYEWIEPLKDEYKIYAFYNKWHPDTLSIIPPYITPIQLTKFEEYIKFTSKIEQHIVTANETYSYTVLDMIIMGIRILTPSGFLPQYQINRFNIPTFKNQEELINEITKPFDSTILNKNIEKCTPMNRVVEIIDTKLQEYL